MEERLTEEQCREQFQRLFPNGLDDASLVQKLAPEGWERSPLMLAYHPTAEQVYEETLRFHENLRRLMGKTASPEEEPQITLDALRREMPVEAPEPVEECADLLGCCLWDLFADNHEVRTANGALVDLGSFRAAAGFIADVRHRRTRSEAWLSERSDYREFYLGTGMVRHRADLSRRPPRTWPGWWSAWSPTSPTSAGRPGLSGESDLYYTDVLHNWMGSSWEQASVCRLDSNGSYRVWPKSGEPQNPRSFAAS